MARDSQNAYLACSRASAPASSAGRMQRSNAATSRAPPCASCREAATQPCRDATASASFGTSSTSCMPAAAWRATS